MRQPRAAVIEPEEKERAIFRRLLEEHAAGFRVEMFSSFPEYAAWFNARNRYNAAQLSLVNFGLFQEHYKGDAGPALFEHEKPERGSERIWILEDEPFYRTSAGRDAFRLLNWRNCPTIVKRPEASEYRHQLYGRIDEYGMRDRERLHLPHKVGFIGAGFLGLAGLLELVYCDPDHLIEHMYLWGEGKERMEKTRKQLRKCGYKLWSGCTATADIDEFFSYKPDIVFITRGDPSVDHSAKSGQGKMEVQREWSLTFYPRITAVLEAMERNEFSGTCVMMTNAPEILCWAAVRQYELRCAFTSISADEQRVLEATLNRIRPYRPDAGRRGLKVPVAGLHGLTKALLYRAVIRRECQVPEEFVAQVLAQHELPFSLAAIAEELEQNASKMRFKHYEMGVVENRPREVEDWLPPYPYFDVTYAFTQGLYDLGFLRTTSTYAWMGKASLAQYPQSFVTSECAMDRKKGTITSTLPLEDYVSLKLHQQLAFEKKVGRELLEMYPRIR